LGNGCPGFDCSQRMCHHAAKSDNGWHSWSNRVGFAKFRQSIKPTHAERITDPDVGDL